MGNRKIKGIICSVLIFVLCLSCTMVASAYFDRGVVGVSLGTGGVSLGIGESASVSVSFSPASSNQLPGCGMAECPQTCGEKECLNEAGECTCNGKNYQTYYAYGSVSSSNTSVATADYSDGVVYVYAVSPGDAVITVTGSLRQFTSSSASFTVSVAAPPEPATTAAPETTKAAAQQTDPATENAGGQKSGNHEKTTKQAVAAERVTSGGKKQKETKKEKTTEETTTKDDKNKDKDKELYTVVKSDKGTIWFVPSVKGKTVKKVLKKATGKEVYVDFQSKDQSDTIQYAWEFFGKDLKEAAAADLSLTIGTNAFSRIKEDTLKNALYLEYAEETSLPAEASLFIRVADYYKNDTELYVYTVAEDGTLTLADDKVKVENGYVTLSVKEREGLVFTDKKLKADKETTTREKETTTKEETASVQQTTAESETPAESAGAESSGSSPLVWIVIVVIVVLLAIAAVLFAKRKKGRNKTE